MPNITASSAANFIPELWANRALEVLRNQIVVARLVAKDSDVAAFNVGDALNIPFVGSFTANEKAAGSPVTLQQPTDGTVKVTLDHHREISFLVEDAAQAQANQELMDRYIEAAIPAMVEAIERDIFIEMGNATNAVGTYGTDIGQAALLGARKALTDAKAPMSGRSLVISTKDEIALLGDPDLAPYFANSRTEGISEGSLGRLYGFDIYASQLAPVVDGTPDETSNFAFHRNAMMLAMRSLPEVPAQMGARSAAVRDPQSGLVLRAVMAYNPSFLGVQVTIDALYGVKLVRQALITEVKA